MRLKREVEKKRPKLINRKGVIFQNDNARPHASLATHQLLSLIAYTHSQETDNQLLNAIYRLVKSKCERKIRVAIQYLPSGGGGWRLRRRGAVT
ncbi:hypothetical protein EVAR_12785_1 [Eumeta japonica]|uniref:Histone-lysine N-methyltransferase SETMAR n=1 Tax=Eumeta variegata TaxID=151549 RepID=A0A4C1UAR0_EUMVA|nr:hypothetical protein EVAR_12785_1 [Eumeta japonica]